VRSAAALLLLAAGGCAAGPAPQAPSPTTLFAQALDATEAGNIPLAVKRLDAIPDSSSLSRQALLLKALLALDPRNPSRAPGQAADLAAQYSATARNRVDAALGTFLYAMALDLGAPPDSGASSLHLPARTLASRLQELEQAVARLRTELARIQETLKP
jgi:hypothetical protein